MCGRYLIDDEAFDLREIIAAAERNSQLNTAWSSFKSGEIFPGSYAPVIASDNEPQFMLWGFPGMLAGKQPHINARSETAASKRTFSDAMASRRCLVPACGYYEWKAASKKQKERYEFTLPDRMPMYMAGIYTDDKFAILTRAASPPVAHIHDRMPVIFDKSLGAAWLGNKPDVIYEALTELQTRHIPKTTEQQAQMDIFN